MNDEHLRQRLRAAADTHRPDRERMLARIERGMRPGSDEPARRPAVGWVRIVGITAGVAGALAVGGFAVGSALRPDPAPRQQQVAVSPSTTAATPATPSPDATSRSRSPSASAPPSAPASSTASKAPPASPPASRTAPAGPGDTKRLWGDGSVDPGSNDYWGQSNVTFKTERQLTALTVELRVAQTGKVADTGNWRSLPDDDFAVTVVERDGFLVYRWVLRAGRSVPAGEHVFAGQYNHAEGGRDASRDAYVVSGRTGGGQRVAVGGDFE
ncbi:MULTISPECIES: hypothetical protein [unclassified Streptomyces]|uniref:hypothetical protein n=1 Tax=unclassified Streptomyces TaxID=2593676 RepID=UPI00278BCBA6|nr:MULTISPECIES: hypothetical protein [unclassified Streptomyces]